MYVLPASTDILSIPNAGLDRIFRASPAGPIPDGEAQGTALLFSGTVLGRAIARVVHLLVWQGKVFDRDHGRLLNKVTPFGLRRFPAEVRHGPSLVDGKECVVVDYSHTPGPVGGLQDEIRLVAPNLYLGVIFFRGRRVMAAFSLRFGTGSAGRV
ncbi:hypothetical protein [Actinomadura alba]|uniref:hypothetical protein n=1 Tax=Actinomadura alba TaxID=406431 RepID=UPI001C9BBEE8|nr:hypothetical protein [Actinomadura alba]